MGCLSCLGFLRGIDWSQAKTISSIVDVTNASVLASARAAEPSCPPINNLSKLGHVQLIYVPAAWPFLKFHYSTMLVMNIKSNILITTDHIFLRNRERERERSSTEATQAQGLCQGSCLAVQDAGKLA